MRFFTTGDKVTFKFLAPRQPDPPVIWQCVGEVLNCAESSEGSVLRVRPLGIFRYLENWQEYGQREVMFRPRDMLLRPSECEHLFTAAQPQTEEIHHG